MDDEVAAGPSEAESARDDQLLGLALLHGYVEADDVTRLARRGEHPWHALVRLERLDADTVAELEEELATRNPVSSGSWIENASPPASARESGGFRAHGAPGEPQFRSMWGRYELGPLLGAGGMGQVYSAYDPGLSRHVALKLLTNASPDTLARFASEARAQARIEHPNVCRVYEVGDVKGTPYIALQLLNGKTLLEASKDLTIDQKVVVLQKVADAVQAAHTIGLIHRDLKPANVMVEKRDDGTLVPFVLDFGLARELEAPGLTATGVSMGTPYYMAPEQVRGNAAQLDRRTDVYALGVTLYEVLSGKPPFEGDTGLEVMMRLVSDDAVPLRQVNPAVSQDLETIVMKCLEKEPSRRYDSARALAEDLSRYLAGEPLAARATTIFERVVKKARRNRAATAAIAVASFAALVLLGLFIETRLTIAERARLAQNLGREVARMDEMVRLSSAIPLHDTTPTKRLLRKRMAAIETESRRVGRAGVGPGLYAVGRAHLALGEDVKARDHLERAYRSDYTDPDVAYSLGLAFGRLYKRELERLDAVRNPEIRETQRKRIERDFRAPALRYLKEGREAAVEAPEYAEGLLAFYEKREEEALGKARAALERSPWLHEAKLLEAEVLLARANRLRDEGKDEAAGAAYTVAEGAFLEAREIGSSDVRVFEGLLSTYANELQMRVYGKGGDIATLALRARKAAADASIADRERSLAPEKLSWVLRAAGDYENQNGRDPLPAWNEAVASAREAIARDGENAQAFRHLGTALQVISAAEEKKGGDPRERLVEAIAAYEKAVALSPNDASIYNNLGNTYGVKADWERFHGVDPRPSLNASIQVFQKSLELDPRLPLAWNNMAISVKDRAGWEASRGLPEAAASVDEAIGYYQKALELNPTYLYATNNLGAVYMQKARLFIDTGAGDPVPFLDLAEKLCTKATEMNPKYNSPRIILGATFIQRAAWAKGQGEDPTPMRDKAIASFRMAAEITKGNNPGPFEELAALHLAKARDAFEKGADPKADLASARESAEKALSISPKGSGILQRLGEIAALEGRILAAAGKSPEPAFAKAEELLSRSVSENEGRGFAFTAFAELARRKAEWLLAKGRTEEAAKEIARGLERTDDALKTNPRNGDALLKRGTLRLLEARATAEPAARRKAAESAIELLSRAAAAKPVLKKDAEALKEEAKNVPGA